MEPEIFDFDVANVLLPFKTKDVFLRGLIFNAADAVRIRDERRDDHTEFDMESEVPIRVIVDQRQRVLTVEDAGVGMTKTELVEFLGRVGISGTQEFVKR